MDVKHELGHFSEWYDLGLNLGLSPKHLKVIERNYTMANDRLNEVLLEWLKKNYNLEKHDLPSWSALVNAVEPIDCDLALIIKKRHLS